jgi:signal transduction histidine kinase
MAGLTPGMPRPADLPGIVFWFVVFRGLFNGGAALLKRVRRRLRWQLLVSHVGVTVLMLATLTAIGSSIGVGIVLTGIAPHPAMSAASVADTLSTTGAVSAHDRARIDQVVRLVYARRFSLRGEPPLAGYAPTAFLPKSIIVANLDRRILAGRTDLGTDGKRTRLARWSDLRPVPVDWPQVRRLALAGRAARLGQNGTLVVAEAPIRDASGRVSGVVLLATKDYRPSSGQLLRVLVAAFGVSTFVLILVTAVPMIALSFLFSYLVARGLTRRLESVSRVTTAIAAGNLSERAPATSGNEVGRLAEDVNRMAGHLQTTMSELEGARAQAEEELMLRRRLMADISHELRTPLATMRAHLESLELRHSVPAGSGSGGEREIVLPAATSAALWDETARLESMVDDLFALAQAEAGAITVQAERLNVCALLREIAERMGPLARQEGEITLLAEVPDGAITALADPDRVHQIISNLVRNAVRHTPEGGIIVLSATRQREWAVLCVADTGEGIPAEDLPYIFERFYRSDPARARASGGAGLGLAIVREFVELMGGRVEVESAVGEGTRFKIFLPTAP